MNQPSPLRHCASDRSRTAYHNVLDPDDLRDRTPPVGAIMDIQMMHASHLFNSKNLTNNSPVCRPTENDSVSTRDDDEEEDDDDDDVVSQVREEGNDVVEAKNITGNAPRNSLDNNEEYSEGSDTQADDSGDEVLSDAGSGWDVTEEADQNTETGSVTDDGGSDAEGDSVGSGEESMYDETDEEEEPTDPKVIEEIAAVQEIFRGIEKHFRLINKIGEGTFSSVYKAEDLQYDRYENGWDYDNDDSRWTPQKRRKSPNDQSSSSIHRKPKYVAIKKIYVTSSPARIQNELELLHDLSGCESVVPLITAFRHQDQVVAILPYFKHVDFREYFRRLEINDMRFYFRSLFSALRHVHDHNIVHRDIKPTNFLYDCYKRTGVLVDFGLAEREGTDSSYCMCQPTNGERREYRLPSSLNTPSQGYPKNDSRPSKRANRAGTRGFRAPEVLFKCTNQTTKIDIWSAGVILLTMLTKRFPFFNSADDVDATIEIATIFGKARMRHCAALHGCIFEATIPTIGEKGFTLEKIVLWATDRLHSGNAMLPADEALAVNFLYECFELDPVKRISAEEALEHEFLQISPEEEDEYE